MDIEEDFELSSVAGGLQATIKNLSKWIAAVLLGLIIVWKHDPEAMWIASGAVVNNVLKTTPKKVLNQKRSVPNFTSDPGMPSSHAQSIFFTVAVVILSLIQRLGANELTLVMSSIIAAFGSYLSSLRISQQFQTQSQVLAGAIVGHLMVPVMGIQSSFISTLWVRLAVSFDAAAFPISFVLFVIRKFIQG